MVIADDHAIVRDAICELLSEASDPLTLSFTVAATAKNGLEAIAAVKQHQPGLLFLDLSMPLAGGIEILSDVRRWSADTRIVVFTGVTAAGLLASTVAAGADAIFPKSTPPADIIEKLPLIMRGARIVAPELVDTIERGQQIESLTDRERQTLNMIISGKTNKEIASELFLSPKTVDKHRASLMKKLDVHSVAQLLTRALQEGLIDPT